jgi:alpha-glucosidase
MSPPASPAVFRLLTSRGAPTAGAGGVATAGVARLSARAVTTGATLVAVLVLPMVARAATFSVKSPGGQITATLTHARGAGTLRYHLRSRTIPLLDDGALGIRTSIGDFTGGLTYVRQARRVIRETYRLPVGKRSTYLNHASELELTFRKGGRELRLVVRAYDDGLAFRYALPGRGPLDISGETTTFPLAARDITIWGQAHPNSYGYESPLGPVTADRISMPVLAELVDRRHFLFVAQAASYGHYIIPNYQRAGNVLTVAFPLDQREPVKTTLPFASPWRVVIVSPEHPGKIVESTMLENLNPPTEPSLRDASWIRPGRASWDYIAGEGNNLRTWIDFDAKMGWEYHVTDAGWERRVPDIDQVAAYGKSKEVGIIAWGKVANRTALNTPERIEDWMTKLATRGISGAKVDFFDQRDSTAEKTDDLEDTQQRLMVRDWLSDAAARHQLLVEFHGCAVPSGERRRWPNLMSAEAVYGLERRNQVVPHDLTIPYVRNVMGPVSFTPLHLSRSPGSLAYQLAQVVLYEAGIQIFAERHERILGFPAVDFLKAVPAAWDDTKFIDGRPASHAVLARRAGARWFLGGITGEARTARIPLTFLARGTPYRALLYRDGADKTALVQETRTVTSKDTLEIPMLAAGGFAVQLEPEQGP